MMVNIQLWWNDEYNYIDRTAKASKNSQTAWFELSRRYLALSPAEKEDVNRVLVGWVESENAGKRSDALWLIQEYKIVEAKSALQHLCFLLKDCKIPENPQGYYEHEDALKILNLLSEH